MTDGPEAIAIIGVGARLPGAVDVAQYWRNLRAGQDASTPLTDEQLLGFGVTPEELADPDYVRAGYEVPYLRDFDHDFFGMTTREARVSDPQVKLFLEVSHAAVEDAGFDPLTMGRDVGVFASAGQARYTDLYVNGTLKHHQSATVVLNNTDYIATTTAYRLNLRGPALTVMTACSSSFVATHLACQSLLLGECDMALAGGANVELPYGHGYRWGPGAVMSRDGRCRSFDASATGTVFSNGAAAVLLKRLPDAVADGDHIRAVIHGTGINNDGSDKMSFGAPSIEGQAAAIVQAMRVAGVSPQDISYVEAHGTATIVGDPVEIAGLHRAYRTLTDEELPPGSIAIGSVKSNIGHTTPTAGVAGLIKVALALEAQELPPSVNFTEPNPRLELDKTPFFINSRLRPWARDATRPRLAGVSSFGVGGTNVHAVVGEGPAPVATPVDGRPRIVVWSGRTAAAVEESGARLGRFLDDLPDDRFVDATATLQRGRAHHRVRSGVVVADRAEAARAIADGGSVVANLEAPDVDRDVVFVFPGQASQHGAMGAGLYGTDAVFTAEIDRCFAVLNDGAKLREYWLRGDDELLAATALAQPLLFAVEHALARMFTGIGIRPAAVIGHSLGELVAAAVAGVLSVEDALRLVELRGRLMQEQPPGSMLAVRGDVETVRDRLPAGCSVAVVNGPQQVVVAAPADCGAAVDAFTASGLATRRLPTSHAFHSSAMLGAVAPFTAAVADTTLRTADLPLYSAATGRELTPEQTTDPRFWAGQLVEPVRFDRAADSLLAGGPRTLLEVGPGRVLTRLLAKHPAVRAGTSVAVPVLPAADRPDRDDERSFAEAVAALWVNGHDPDWSALRPDEPLRRIPVPGYPYQRVRCWIEPTTGPAAPHTVHAVETPPETRPVAAAVAATTPAFSTVSWSERPPARRGGDPGGGRGLALLPADGASSLPLVLALQRCGYEVIRIRPGTGYSADGREFQVRPGSVADLEAVFDALASAGRQPDTVVHGWAFDEWEAVSSGAMSGQVERAVHGLHALAKVAVRRHTGHRPLRVLVVTTGAVDVSGTTPAHPVKAMLPAIVRSFAAETPGSVCRLVDVADVDEEDLADELASDAVDPVVALRADRRWLPRELAVDPRTGSSVLRRDGVYLITGGLGGLGLAVARGLAGTGLRPRLILAGRTLEQPDGAVAAVVADLEAMGAQVRLQACDVADRRAVARMLDIAVAQFGPLNGVLHLAGVPGDGMLAFAGHEDADRIGRPKVQGTVTLAEALAGRGRLDFFVAFSSRAALAGMVGSGHYAGANAFLDAYAQSARHRPVLADRVLSIGWPAWSGVGMAAAAMERVAPAGSVAGPGDTRDFVTTLSPRTCWALDEHRVDGVAVLPGTGHLDLALRAFHSVFVADDATPVVFEDVMFVRPLLARQPREVRVRFTTDGDRYRFVVASRLETADEVDDSDPAWTEHVNGQVGAGGAALSAPSVREAIDVDRLLGGMSEVGTPPTRPSVRMFALGPRWRTFVDAWEGGTTKVLRLRLPAPFRADLDEHPLHPALLDSATSALRNPDSDGLQLPFMYKRLVVHRPLPAEFFSRIRRHEGGKRSVVGDIELFSPDGDLLAEITGFTMRQVDRDAFTHKLPPSTVEATVTRPGRGVSADERDPTAGLAPERGVELLLELLSARTPAHVLVRPFENGQPVPLPVTPAGDGGDVAGPAAVWAAAVRAPRTPPDAPETPAPRAEPGSDPDSVEAKIRDLWTEVLGAAGFDAGADFFDVGGDSMSAVQLLGRIRDVFRVELAVGAVFEHPSVAGLAAEIRRAGRG